MPRIHIEDLVEEIDLGEEEIRRVVGGRGIRLSGLRVRDVLGNRPWLRPWQTSGLRVKEL